ncbi:MAG: GGDEF domain-containing protein [Rhodobacteraceae bacterium]|nr:GGDEF domain-containing protein [Paracoccaceae bacterium]
MALLLTSSPRHIRFGWGLWAVAMLLSGACAILIGLRNIIPDIFSIALANALMLFGFGLRPNALSMINSQKLAYQWLPFIAFFGWLTFYLMPWFREDLVLRVLYANSLSTIAMGLCVWECRKTIKTQKISSWVLIIFCSLDILIRLNLIVSHLQTRFPSFEASFTTTSILTGLVVLLVAIILQVAGLGIVYFEQVKQRYETETLREPITGLRNRRAFYDACQIKISGLGFRKPLGYALVTFEIDDLKSITERYGHSMSEAFLRLFGSIGTKHLPPGAEFGHLRDDQFGLLLPGADQTKACAIAQRISRTFTTECATASSRQLTVTLSVGVFCGDNTPFERALEIANHCLRHALANGGNQIVTNDGSGDGGVKSETVSPPFAPRQKSTG